MLPASEIMKCDKNQVILFISITMPIAHCKPSCSCSPISGLYTEIVGLVDDKFIENYLFFIASRTLVLKTFLVDESRRVFPLRDSSVSYC